MGGGQSCWKVSVADTVEVKGSGSRVEQGNEDMRMNRKMSFFPVLTVHSFLLPLVFASFKMPVWLEMQRK